MMPDDIDTTNNTPVGQMVWSLEPMSSDGEEWTIPESIINKKPEDKKQSLKDIDLEVRNCVLAPILNWPHINQDGELIASYQSPPKARYRYQQHFNQYKGHYKILRANPHEGQMVTLALYTPYLNELQLRRLEGLGAKSRIYLRAIERSFITNIPNLKVIQNAF